MENISEPGSEKEVNTFFSLWKRFRKPVLGIAIGAAAGFLYYYFIGCSSGSCPITSNPYMSILWGGLLGLFITSSPCSRGSCQV